MFFLNAYKIAYIVTGIVTFILGFLSLRHKEKVNTIFFFMCLITGMWFFLWSILFNLADKDIGLFIAKLGYSFIVFIPPVFYHFVTEALKMKEKYISIIVYLLSFIFLVCIWSSDLFVCDIYKYSFGFYPKAGKLHILHLLQLSFVVVRGFYILYKSIKQERRIYKKIRNQYIFWGLLIYLPAAFDYLANYGVDIIPPSVVFIIASMSYFAYAMLKHHLLDIYVTLTKTGLAICGFIGFLFLFYLIINILLPSIIKYKVYRIYICGIVTSIGAFGIYLFLKFILSLKVKDILKNKVGWYSLLKNMVDKLSQVRNLREMLVYTVRVVRQALGVDFVAVAHINKTKDAYIIRKVSSITKDKPSKNYENKLILTSAPLIRFLKKYQRPLELEYINFLLSKKNLSNQTRQELEELQKYMQEKNISGVIGSFIGGDLIGLLLLGDKVRGINFTASDLDLLNSIANEVGISLEAVLTRRDEIELLLASKEVILRAIDAKDAYTFSHSIRVKNLCSLLAKKSEKIRRLISALPDSISGLEIAAGLHDLGKIAIPDSILNKPGKLNQEEWEYIKKHPEVGVEIVYSMERWLGKDTIRGILEHQEHYDGRGYPKNKKYNDIHPYARIIHVVDAYDAMTSQRPYKNKPFSQEEAIQELLKNKYTQFDPLITDEFIKILIEYPQDTLKKIPSYTIAP